MQRENEKTARSGMAGAGSGQDPVLSLYSVIEESARLLEIPCSREKVLSVYGDGLPEAVIAFRIATSARQAGDLDCRFTVPLGADPYELAASNGFTAQTGHPVGALLSDIWECCPISSYGINFGVTGGFKKIWLIFPGDELQAVSELAGIPSMPRSLGENAGFFARHGLDDMAGIIGIDYRDRTVNVYFNEPAACFARRTYDQ